ncbi:MAG: lysophospholipid acyltransferase family protein [Saprospiraceae bacterium]
MQKIRAGIRGVGFLFILMYHFSGILLYALFHKDPLPGGLRIRRKFCRRSLKWLGVHVERTGEIPQGGPFLYIGNHRSYLDPIAALIDIDALPVAKAEVSSWPLIGYGGKITGIMYVKRESKSSRAATLEAMRKTLVSGHSVLVYPEGTTHTNPQTIPFKGGAFNLAAKESVPIVPIAIDYLDMGDAWVGNDTFVPHFIRCFGKKRTHIKIRYGQPVSSGDLNFLMETSKKWIDETMKDIRAEFEAGAKTRPD